MNIRSCQLKDAEAISEIYNHYIKNTVITFEEECVTTDIIEKRIEAGTKTHPWLVIENSKNKVVGYAYASKWQPRSAYQYTVEITVYLDKDSSGNGYGSLLYKALLDLLKASDFHRVIAGIALPNEASIKLQESFGFKKVAHFEQVGFKFGKWIDVGQWQLEL